MTKRQDTTSRGKGHFRMEEFTEAISYSSHSRGFAMQWNRDKDKRKVAKANQQKFYWSHMATEILKAVLAWRGN